MKAARPALGRDEIAVDVRARRRNVDIDAASGGNFWLAVLGARRCRVQTAAWRRQSHAAGVVMSGRRPLIKGYFRRCAGRGCGHVFGLVLRRIESAGPDVVSGSVAADHVSALDCADNASGFRINPLSCASPLSHPRFPYRLGCWEALAANATSAR